jgi:hypothetical protein
VFGGPGIVERVLALDAKSRGKDRYKSRIAAILKPANKKKRCLPWDFDRRGYLALGIRAGRDQLYVKVGL